MSDAERDRWNAKYSQGEHTSAEPSRVLTELVDWLPKNGRAIDVAGGAGRHAIWLAKQGLSVTLADLSDVALETARQRAAEAAVVLTTLAIDLEEADFPEGRWDLIVAVHYLWRPLFDVFPTALAPRGKLICIHPTRSNLQRHAKPSDRFLLEEGELRGLASDLRVLHYVEEWSVEGRHEAVLVAEA